MKQLKIIGGIAVFFIVILAIGNAKVEARAAKAEARAAAAEKQAALAEARAELAMQAAGNEPDAQYNRRRRRTRGAAAIPSFLGRQN